MANKTVTFISNQYGNARIDNMASEATLKELLDAVGSIPGMSNSSGGVDLYDKLKKGTEKFEDGLEAVMKPFTGFVKLVSANESRMSVFADHINDTVVKHIPLVGGALSGLTSVFSSGVSILEDWDRSSRELAPLGATFNNSILEFRESAARARMDVDRFSSLVAQNIQYLIGLGRTTNEGIRNAVRFSEELYAGANPVAHQLLQMGLSVDDINEEMIQYLYKTNRSFGSSIEVNQQTANAFGSYVKQNLMLNRLFGERSDSQAGSTRQSLRESVFLLNSAREMDNSTRTKLEMGISTIQGLYGENAADLFRTYANGLVPLDQAMNDLRIIFPGATGAIRTMLEGARNRAVTPQRFETMLDSVLVDQIMYARSQASSMESLLIAFSTGSEDMRQLGRTVGPVLQYLARMGDVYDMSEEQIRQNIAEARREGQRRESITELLRGFSAMAREFKTGLMMGILGGLQTIDMGLAQANLDQTFRNLGGQFALMVTDAWPKIKNFFGYLRTSDGQAFILNAGRAWYHYSKDIIGLRLQRAVSSFVERIFGVTVSSVLPGYISEEEFDEAIDAARVRREAVIREESIRRENPASFTLPENFRATPGTRVYIDWARFRGEGQGEDYGALEMSDDGIWRAEGILPEWFRAEAIQEELIQRANLLAYQQQETTMPTRLGVLGYRGRAESVEVNARYQDRFQTLIDFLESNGYNIERIVGYNTNPTAGGSEFQRVGAAIDINPDSNNLIEFLTQRNLLESFRAYAQLAGIGLEALDRNVLSAGRTEGGTHRDPNSFRYGTLGMTGQLFKDFGPKTTATLHGEEAIVTKEQMGSLMAQHSQIPVKDLINSLNTTVSDLIDLTHREILVERDRLYSYSS